MMNQQTLPVEVGQRIESEPFDWDDKMAWIELAARMLNLADEYGAWFVVGQKPNCDTLVVDLLRHRTEVAYLLQRHNLRSFTFWRFPS